METLSFGGGFIQFSDRGLNPAPLHWERGVLAPGPPGKSPSLSFEITCQIMTQLMLFPLPLQEKILGLLDVSGPSVKGPILLAGLPSASSLSQF